MLAILQSLGMCIIVLFKSRRRLEAENLFLRHQLSIALRRAPPRLRLRGSDRALLVWMTRLWPSLLGCGPGASTGDDGFPAPLDIGREAADRGRELRHRGGCRRRRGGMGCLRASCSRGAVWPERGGTSRAPHADVGVARWLRAPLASWRSPGGWALKCHRSLKRNLGYRGTHRCF